MRKTRHPARINQRLVIRAALYSAGVNSWATAGVAVRTTAATTPKRPKPTLWSRLLAALRLHDVLIDRVILLTIAPPEVDVGSNGPKVRVVDFANVRSA
jgi:hypothetical protein|tara:strand:- start:1096 stop:1392 length:297 start_codon:yes stop_codon:yes gene_type:complete